MSVQRITEVEEDTSIEFNSVSVKDQISCLQESIFSVGNLLNFTEGEQVSVALLPIYRDMLHQFLTLDAMINSHIILTKEKFLE